MWPERHPGLRGSRILSSPDRGAGRYRSSALRELDDAGCHLHGVLPTEFAAYADSISARHSTTVESIRRHFGARAGGAFTFC
jgi:hypothetical protein